MLGVFPPTSQFFRKSGLKISVRFNQLKRKFSTQAFTNAENPSENPVTIHFGRGYPAEDMLPVDLMRKASEHCFSKGSPKILRYAAERGPQRFLEQLSKFLNRNVGYSGIPGFSVLEEHLMITSGCSQGISWACREFTTPGDTIFVEDPTYFLALEIFKRDHRLKVIGARMDQNGLILDENFENLCKIYKPKLVYTIPSHHNPTGITMSRDRRLKLVEFSRKYNFIVLADETYQLVNFQNYTPPPPMVFFDKSEDSLVIGLGSFAKILAPGVRLGWIHTSNKSFMNKLSSTGELLSGGNANLVPNIVQSAIELGLLDEQLSIYRKQYQERTEKGIQLLRKSFHGNSTVPFLVPDYVRGGYFVWVQILDQSTNAQNLLKKCKPFNVAFNVGEIASTDGNFRDFIRFCFVFWNLKQIETGISNMAKALL